MHCFIYKRIYRLRMGGDTVLFYHSTAVFVFLMMLYDDVILL